MLDVAKVEAELRSLQGDGQAELRSLDSPGNGRGDARHVKM